MAAALRCGSVVRRGRRLAKSVCRLSTAEMGVADSDPIKTAELMKTPPKKQLCAGSDKPAVSRDAPSAQRHTGLPGTTERFAMASRAEAKANPAGTDGAEADPSVPQGFSLSAAQRFRAAHKVRGWRSAGACVLRKGPCWGSAGALRAEGASSTMLLQPSDR